MAGYRGYPPQKPGYGYSPSVAPGYGPPQAAPQSQHHVTYINVQQPQVTYVSSNQRSTASRAAGFVGGMVGSAVRGAVNVTSDVAREIVNEVDRHAESPLLDCFRPGCAVQLKSRVSSLGGGCLRIYEPAGTVDARGALGNDYTCHFFVVSRYQNKVVLRSVANPAHHLAMASGQVLGMGVGDRASTFRIHETFNHYVTFEHEMTGHMLGVDKEGTPLSPSYLTRGQKETEFEVHLMHSPFGHRYTPTH